MWLFVAECVGVHMGGPVGMDTWHIAPRTKRHGRGCQGSESGSGGWVAVAGTRCKGQRDVSMAFALVQRSYGVNRGP